MTTTDTIDRTDDNVLTRLSDDLASAVERAGAWTVTVNARRRMPASGIVWSGDGLIVTANHVVEQNEDITVGLSDGRTVPAKLLGRDPGSDIALLKLEVGGLAVPPRVEDPVRPGNLTLAIGRPGPSGPMASFGVVSVVGGSWRTHRGHSVEGFVRADVAMLPGFSGGPLVDSAGHLIGLNSSTLGRGSGLTVLATAIDGVVTALQTHGKVRRGFLGIGAQAVTIPSALARAAGISQETGLVVVNVDPGSPAERDGIFLGDVIFAVNDTPVASVEELMDNLAGDLVGQPVRIQVIRGGHKQDVTVTVGERS